MSDGPYEKKFCKWINSIGGKHFKGPAMIVKGIPDRIAFLPNLGGTVYVEFKESELRDLEPMQKWWRNVLINSDPNRYFVVDNEKSLEYTINRCKRLIEIGKDTYQFVQEKLIASGEDAFTDLRNSTLFPVVFTDNNTLLYFDYSSHKDAPRIGDNYVRMFFNSLPEDPNNLKGSLILLNDLVYIIKSVEWEGLLIRCNICIYYQYKGQSTASPFKYIS